MKLFHLNFSGVCILFFFFYSSFAQNKLRANNQQSKELALELQIHGQWNVTGLDTRMAYFPNICPSLGIKYRRHLFVAAPMFATWLSIPNNDGHHTRIDRKPVLSGFQSEYLLFFRSLEKKINFFGAYNFCYERFQYYSSWSSGSDKIEQAYYFNSILFGTRVNFFSRNIALEGAAGLGFAVGERKETDSRFNDYTGTYSVIPHFDGNRPCAVVKVGLVYQLTANHSSNKKHLGAKWPQK